MLLPRIKHSCTEDSYFTSAFPEEVDAEAGSTETCDNLRQDMELVQKMQKIPKTKLTTARASTPARVAWDILLPELMNELSPLLRL